MSIKYSYSLKAHKNIFDTIKMVEEEFYLYLTSFSLVKKIYRENYIYTLSGHFSHSLKEHKIIELVPYNYWFLIFHVYFQNLSE